MAGDRARKPRVLIFYNEAGGGHRAAAHALEAVLRDTWDVTLVNPVRDLYGPYDGFTRCTGGNMEAFYNDVVLARSWGVIGTTLYFLVASLNLLLHGGKVVAGGRRLYAEHEPDVVISVLSGVNHLFVASVRPDDARPPALVFVNTDFQETFPWSWFPRTGDYYAVTGTERSYQQALRTVGRPDRVFRTSGMPVRPSMYAERVADVRAERARLGLDPDRLTVAVLYGGHGADRMASIAAWLAEAGDVQAIFLCGNNPALRARLEALPLGYPRQLVGWTKEIHRWFDLADVVIGKPGPGCISEALVRGRPVLVDRSRVMPQEVYNGRWVVEAGVGLDFRTRSDFLDAVRAVRSEEGRARLARNVAEHENRAIFEIPDILEEILASRASADAPDEVSRVA